MGSFNANILPATVGLNLGSSDQKWTGYFSNSFADVMQSGTVNPSLTGAVRLACTDTVSWRSTDNTSNLALGLTGAASGNIPADCLSFSGSILSTFISSAANPASAGELRLAKGDAINFRNNANSADVNGLKHNTDDTVTVGGTAGIKTGGAIASTGAVTAPSANFSGTVTASAFISNSTSVASAGTVRMAFADSIKFRNATNSADLIGLSSSGLSDNVIVVGDTPGISIKGGVSSCGGVSTSNGGAGNGFGVPLFVTCTSQRSEVAADTNVLTYTPAASAGTYRIEFAMSVSAANTATLGWSAAWTDSNGHAQAPTNLSLLKAGTAAPALTFSAAANDTYYASAIVDIDNSSTSIIVKLTFSGTSFTAKVTATIERLI